MRRSRGEEDGPPGGAQAVPTTSGEAAALKIDPSKVQSITIPDTPTIIVKTDVDTLQLDRITKPEWASAIGRDRYGLWADFSLTVGTSENTALQELLGSETPKQQEFSVKQRMRWIPPGRFMMGSPDNDDMAHDWEKPQHEVTISHGYWLFDTPVTQELWAAVMNENPSNYTRLKRPVEQVSWDDSQLFLQRIAKSIAGLELVLPTESEWEYACRAGTSSRYAFGDEISAEQARFGATDGTVDVATYQPNARGLYDLHGNVYEWCQDWWSDYDSAAESIDPQGPTEGQDRVLRGGSWADHARYVRSAYRGARSPGSRNGLIGFRCAQVHSSSRGVSKQSEGLGVATEEQP